MLNFKESLYAVGIIAVGIGAGIAVYSVLRLVVRLANATAWGRAAEPFVRRSAGVLCLSVPALLMLSACGGGDGGDNVDDSEFELSSNFDASRLPADFPRHVIPADYDSANYMDLGSVATASFESDAAAAETIAYYRSMLGEPRIENQNPNGQQSAQWDLSPWMLSVVGGADESIIGVSKTGN